MNINNLKNAILKSSLKSISYEETNEKCKNAHNINIICKLNIDFNFDNYNGDRYLDYEIILKDSQVMNHLISIIKESYHSLITNTNNKYFEEIVKFYYNDEHRNNKVDNFKEISSDYVHEYIKNLDQCIKDLELTLFQQFDLTIKDNEISFGLI